jgi:DNA-binding response OmpR family regulator
MKNPDDGRDGGPTRVLVIEDESLIAMDLESELVDRGYEVIGPAATVEHAERLASSEKFEAAVLDMNLRGRNVHSVLDVLKKKRVPFLILSGYSNPLLPTGVKPTRRLQKPVDSRQVAETLSSMLARKGNHGPGGR